MTLFDTYLEQVRKEEKTYVGDNPIEKIWEENFKKGLENEINNIDRHKTVYKEEDEQVEEEIKSKEKVIEKKKKPEVKEDKREEIILTWLKSLNAKYKPYAEFKIIIEKNSEGEDDMYMSLKPQDSEGDRYFYHLSAEETLSEEVYGKIILLAEKQLSQKAAITEEVKIKAVNGWRKKKNINAILEFKSKDSKKTLEIISESKRGGFKGKTKIKNYAIVYFNEDEQVYKILEQNIKNIAEIEIKTIEYMKNL